MSMSTHITGFIPPDEKWKTMKEIYDNCEKLNIEIPQEVESFFGGDKPDALGRNIELKVQEWYDPDAAEQGYELLVADIPKDVKVIRFYNSW